MKLKLSDEMSKYGVTYWNGQYSTPNGQGYATPFEAIKEAKKLELEALEASKKEYAENPVNIFWNGLTEKERFAFRLEFNGNDALYNEYESVAHYAMHKAK